MDIHEQVALRMAREWIEDAVRAAEAMPAIRSTRARQTARVRVGSALVRLGHWMMGHPSPATS
jgi:hypothetical protein